MENFDRKYKKCQIFNSPLQMVTVNDPTQNSKSHNCWKLKEPLKCHLNIPIFSRSTVTHGKETLKCHNF